MEEERDTSLGPRGWLRAERERGRERNCEIVYYVMYFAVPYQIFPKLFIKIGQLYCAHIHIYLLIFNISISILSFRKKKLFRVETN